MQASEESRSREKQMKKATYEYCKSQGICPVCRKEPAFYNHVLCPSCMEKRSGQKARFWANITDEQKEHINALKRERYHKNKEAGLCVNCGRTAQENKTLCLICSVQMRRSGAEYRIRSGRKKGYAEAGLCIRCGEKPLDGKRLCADCMAKNRESMAHARKYAPTGEIGRLARDIEARVEVMGNL